MPGVVRARTRTASPISNRWPGEGSGCTDDAEGAEWVGEAYAGMITVGLTGVDMNDAAVAWEGSSASPKAWQSDREGQGSENFGENHKHDAQYLRVRHKEATKKSEAYEEQHAPYELKLPSLPATSESRSVFLLD